MSTENERMQILEMIERGEITPSQGLDLLKALQDSEPVLQESAYEAEPEQEFEPKPPVPAKSQPLANEPELPAEPTWEAVASQPAGEGMASTSREAERPVEEAASAPAEEPGEATVHGEALPSAARLGPDFSHWRRFWQIPLWIGVAITILSGGLMFLAWQSNGVGWLFACTWFPFFLGVALMALAWSTRNLPWLHIRIQQKPGERPGHIAISLPLPLGLIAWGLRTFKHKIPDVGNVNLEEMAKALKHVSPDAPFSINVDEGEDGERVQIYIG